MLASALALHALAAIFWVGGMAFAYTILRPATGGLEPAARLGLWRAVFARFLPAVAGAILILFATGYLVTFEAYGGFARVGVHVHLMHALALIMTGLFLILWRRIWPEFRRATEAGESQLAAVHLGRIRRLVATNLGLGLATAAIGASGRFW